MSGIYTKESLISSLPGGVLTVCILGIRTCIAAQLSSFFLLSLNTLDDRIECVNNEM